MKETQSQRWRRLNPKRAQAISRKAMRKFRTKNKDWNLRHPKDAIRSTTKSRHISYGFTPEFIRKKKRKQKGTCALPSCSSTKLVPDHDHITGKPRGLLCNKHNAGLGFFGDNLKGLKEAVEYLKKYS